MEYLIYHGGKISGNNISLNIKKTNNNIDISGNINLNIVRKYKEYEIFDGLLNSGSILRKDGLMEFNGNTFNIDPYGLKNLKAQKINLDILFDGKTIAYLHKLKEDMYIDIYNIKYITPAVIYASILSLMVKKYTVDRFILPLYIPVVTGILEFYRIIGFNNPVKYFLVILSISVVPIAFLYILKKPV